MNPQAVVGPVRMGGNDTSASCTGPYERTASLSITHPHDIEVVRQLGITELGGALIIEGDRLTDVDGLASWTRVGHFYFNDNDAIEHLQDLSALEGAKTLAINGNDALVDLTGLENLADIYGRCSSADPGGHFSVSGNASLTSLDGLEQLRHVDPEYWGGKLVLADNAGLASIEALFGLESLGELRVVRNPQLAACRVRQLGARLSPDRLNTFVEFCNDTTQTCG